jgi:hypothetical protein
MCFVSAVAMLSMMAIFFAINALSGALMILLCLLSYSLFVDMIFLWRGGVVTSIEFARTPDGKVLTIDADTGQLTSPLTGQDALFWWDVLTGQLR